MQVSHSLDRLEVIFDDEHLVANGGLMLPAHLESAPGAERAARSPRRPRRCQGTRQRGPQAITLIHSALAGGDSIDGADALRAGETQTASATSCSPPPPSAPSYAVSAGGTPDSSTPSRVSSWPGPGRWEQDQATSP